MNYTCIVVIITPVGEKINRFSAHSAFFQSVLTCLRRDKQKHRRFLTFFVTEIIMQIQYNKSIPYVVASMGEKER